MELTPLLHTLISKEQEHGEKWKWEESILCLENFKHTILTVKDTFNSVLKNRTQYLEKLVSTGKNQANIANPS